MLPTLRIAGLLPLTCLLGCAAASSMTGTSGPTSPSVVPSGYWQFQTSASTPPGLVVLSGVFQTQGSVVTGIFGPGLGCTPPVNNLTGTIDSAGNVTLTAPFVQAQLQFANSDTTASGTSGGGGYLCQAAWQGTVTGTQIATAPGSSLTGAFAGSIYPEIVSPGSGPEAVGTARIVLTQSTTPNSAGQFPLTGSLAFASGACSSTTSLTGLLSGLWITLASTSGPNAITLTAAANPAASQLTAGQILFTPSPCSTTASTSTSYIGTLTRQ